MTAEFKGAIMSTRPLTRFFLIVAACVLLAVSALADSQARIVRLSDVQGNVQINKNIGLGFENAFLNLPVTQGTQLKTLSNGRAEIEFEDGSTMRLAPNSTVEFTTLGVDDSGKHVSAINLTGGMAYVNWLGKDDLKLNFSQEKIALERAAHFRVDLSSQAANVAVFKGDLEVESPTGDVAVAKNKTAAFSPAEDDKATIANKIAPAPLDSWDKESIEYHQQYAKNNDSQSPYGYGLSDLNYYGSYSNISGYGMMWQPFFAGAGWDPFMDGAWGFYPGLGYTFASVYPWGWLPYHYGNWMFIPPYGWMWQPGGWNNMLSVPSYTPTRLASVHSLVAPTGTQKTVFVGKGGTASSLLPTRMTVNAGSAGMGIPRGSLENLNHLNRQVIKSGFAEVHSAPQFAASSPRPFGGFSGPSGGSLSGSSGPSAAGHVSSAGHASSGGSSGGSAHR
jgi:FecR protein